MNTTTTKTAAASIASNGSFDWMKFIIGLLSALLGALTASAAVMINQ